MKESEEGVDVTVLAERRAKLAKLRGEHFVHDRDITSAPSVTVVDEFRYEFAAADWQKTDITHDASNPVESHKIFYAENNKKNNNNRKPSDLEFNALVNEANRRGGKHSATSRDDIIQLDDDVDGFSIASSLSGVLGGDRFEHKYEYNKNTGLSFDHKEKLVTDKNYENSTEERRQRKLTRASTFAGGNDPSDEQNSSKRNQIENEKSTKIYQDGQYVLSSEDLGYQSSASSPNESKRKMSMYSPPNDECTDMKKSGQLLKVEKAMDPLSMSLPETFLKTVKSDLSESIKSNTSTRSKVVYDPRMFTGQAKVAPNNSLDPEKDYFEKMNKFHRNDKLHNNGWRHDKEKDTKQNMDTGDEPSALECIDLSDPVHFAKEGKRELRELATSPALSERTEFEDPDTTGKSRKKKIMNNKSLGGVLLTMSNIGLKFGKENGDGMHNRKKGKIDNHPLSSSLDNSYSSWSGRSPHSGHGVEEDCKICIHRKRTSCWTVLALLALDIFTIGLIIILFNQMHSQPQGIGGHLAQTGGVPDHSHDHQHGGDPVMEPRGRSLDLPIFNDTDNSYLEIESMLSDLKSKFEDEMQNLTEQLKKMRTPPSFSCHKTDSHTSETKVFYSDCSISTPGMDANTGIFKVQEPGVYQITFTGFFVSLRGHMVSADIYLRTGEKDEIIGRSSAKTDEDGVFGRDDDLHATTSIIVMERLREGDKVFVSMVISGPHGDSKLESDFSRKIHFTGLRISD